MVGCCRCQSLCYTTSSSLAWCCVFSAVNNQEVVALRMCHCLWGSVTKMVRFTSSKDQNVPRRSFCYPGRRQRLKYQRSKVGKSKLKIPKSFLAVSPLVVQFASGKQQHVSRWSLYLCRLTLREIGRASCRERV